MRLTSDARTRYTFTLPNRNNSLILGAASFRFFVFAPNFSGGVSVATGDINVDGRSDIVVAPGARTGRAICRISTAAVRTPARCTSARLQRHG